MDQTSIAPPVEGPVSLAEGVGLLAELDQLATQRERLVLRVVETLARVNRAGVVEAVEGLPVDTLLATRHGWSRAEVSMMLDAGDVLASMPAAMAWWQKGVISWSVVRDIVCQVRSLGRDGRRLVDARLHASEDLLVDMDPDRIAWAVADAVEEYRGLTEKERQERLAAQDSYLHFQLDMFGGSKVSGYLDAVDTAIVTNALDHRANQTDNAGNGPTDDASGQGRADADGPTGGPPPPTGPHEPGPGDPGPDNPGPSDGPAPPGPSAGPSPGPGDGHDPAHVDDDSEPRWKRRRTRAKRRARSLVELAREGLAGRDDDGKVVPAKPTMVLHVPLDGITETASGLLECAVPNSLPTISSSLLEILAKDADVRAVLFDGARPLAVSKRVNANDVPEDTKLAVKARDLGARDPAGRTPAPLSHIHHLNPGRHHPDEMVCASPAGHLRIIHRHGWTGTVLPDGVVEWTRGHGPTQTTIRTRPWHTRLREAPADPPHERHT